MTHAMNTIDAAIFRAYDIRGIVDQTLSSEIVFLIGQALGSTFREQNLDEIYVARDGRISGPQLIKALIEGLLASGCDVINLGMVPTPLLYYAAYTSKTRCGIMLTGSHNPPDYNGMKIMFKGVPFAEQELQTLYQRILQKNFLQGEGQLYERDVLNEYIAVIKKDLSIARSLKVVVDAGNGIAGKVAPLLLRSLGCEVIELFCDVNGHFPNHHPDPSQPENLQDLIRSIQKHSADVGLAFDGDGDRLGVVTNAGEIIYPDRLLMLFAQAILRIKPNAQIIYDVKCTQNLSSFIAQKKGRPLMWKTGHSLIKAKLFETKAELAGEMSGHFFFNDRWYGFDDALYSAARLIEILSHAQMSSAEVFKEIPNSINTPELKINVADDEKFSLIQALKANANFEKAEIMTIDGLRINFADGWGLVRASNTSPNLILRFEAINHAMLKNIQALFREWLLTTKPDLVLPF